jgi:hypothetical protein
MFSLLAAMKWTFLCQALYPVVSPQTRNNEASWAWTETSEINSQNKSFHSLKYFSQVFVRNTNNIVFTCNLSTPSHVLISIPCSLQKLIQSKRYRVIILYCSANTESIDTEPIQRSDNINMYLLSHSNSTKIISSISLHLTIIMFGFYYLGLSIE